MNIHKINCRIIRLEISYVQSIDCHVHCRWRQLTMLIIIWKPSKCDILRLALDISDTQKKKGRWFGKKRCLSKNYLLSFLIFFYLKLSFEDLCLIIHFEQQQHHNNTQTNIRSSHSFGRQRCLYMFSREWWSHVLFSSFRNRIFFLHQHRSADLFNWLVASAEREKNPIDVVEIYID